MMTPLITDARAKTAYEYVQGYEYGEGGKAERLAPDTQKDARRSRHRLPSGTAAFQIYATPYKGRGYAMRNAK